MNKLLRPLAVGFCLLATASSAIAEEEFEKEAECAHSVASVPINIKGILSPIYLATPSDERLAAASKELYTLMSDVNFCRVFVLSAQTTSTEKQRDAMEWTSLNQWLTRLTNFTSLNANGDMDRDWKEEYELFIEVYELEI
ncbi:MAG: hypothetical protein O7B81_15595 [Gammaproteobacteria bacterium]|nr:hypothetical protein [Gammaproteobacteria bacterium]